MIELESSHCPFRFYHDYLITFNFRYKRSFSVHENFELYVNLRFKITFKIRTYLKIHYS